MACNHCCSIQNHPFSSSALPWRSSTLFGSPTLLTPTVHSNNPKFQRKGKNNEKSRPFTCKTMVQQSAVQGATTAYAKEMERLSAKESLLLAFLPAVIINEAILDAGGFKSLVTGTTTAIQLIDFKDAGGFKSLATGTTTAIQLIDFKDAGGFKSLVTGSTTAIQLIDVNERIVGLERLNPTPRPSTSPFLEGRWSFDWFGNGSPGFFVAKLLFERFPTTLANLSKMDVLIKDGYANITANLKFVNSIESNFILSARLSVEGPLRMKEEYVEGTFESPTINEEAIPAQLKGAFGQAVNTMQQLPAPIRDAVASGLKIPLGGSFQRLFMISYLDDEILIIRDTSGVPEVLTRLDPAPSTMEDSIPEYES